MPPEIALLIGLSKALLELIYMKRVVRFISRSKRKNAPGHFFESCVKTINQADMLTT